MPHLIPTLCKGSKRSTILCQGKFMWSMSGCTDKLFNFLLVSPSLNQQTRFHFAIQLWFYPWWDAPTLMKFDWVTTNCLGPPVILLWLDEIFIQAHAQNRVRDSAIVQYSTLTVGTVQKCKADLICRHLNLQPSPDCACAMCIKLSNHVCGFPLVVFLIVRNRCRHQNCQVTCKGLCKALFVWLPFWFDLKAMLMWLTHKHDGSFVAKL